MTSWWDGPLRALLGALQHGRHSAAPGTLTGDTPITSFERCELPRAEAGWTCAQCRVPFSLLIRNRNPLRCDAAHVVCGHCAQRDFMVQPTSSWLPMWTSSLNATHSHASPALSDPEEDKLTHVVCPLCPGGAEMKPCLVTRALVRHGDANALRWLLRFHSTVMNTAPLWRGRMHYEGEKGRVHRHACLLFAFQPWCTACWECMDVSEKHYPCVSSTPKWAPRDNSVASHDAHWVCATCAREHEPCRVCARVVGDVVQKAQSERRRAEARVDFLHTWAARLQDCIDWARSKPTLPVGAADLSSLTCSYCRHPFSTAPVSTQPFWTSACDHILCGHCVTALQHTAPSLPCSVCRVDHGSVPASRLPVWRPHTALLTYLLLAGTGTSKDGDAPVCALTQHELQLIGAEPCATCHRVAGAHTRTPRNQDPLFPSQVDDEDEDDVDDEEQKLPLLRLFGEGASDERTRAYQELWPTPDTDGTGMLTTSIGQWVEGTLRAEATVWLHADGPRRVHFSVDAVPSRSHGMSIVAFDGHNNVIRLFLFVAYDGGLLEWGFDHQTAQLRLWVPESDIRSPFPPDHVTIPHPFSAEEPRVTLPLGCLLGCHCVSDQRKCATDDVIVTPLGGSVFWHLTVQHWKPQVHS